MESLFSNPVFSIAVLALMAIYIVAMLATIFLYVTKKSELAGRIFGIMVGLMFLFFLSSQVMDLAGGASLDLHGLSNIITSIAFMFAAAGLMFKKYSLVSSIIFFLLLGPGCFLMMWTADLPGFDAGGLHMLSAVFGILWLMLIAMIGYGYVKYGKKRKTPGD